MPPIWWQSSEPNGPAVAHYNVGMSEQQKRAKSTEKPAEVVAETPQPTERRNTEKVDKLISEIDEVLEENAEEFVRSYVQKGGE